MQTHIFKMATRARIGLVAATSLTLTALWHYPFVSATHAKEISSYEIYVLEAHTIRYDDQSIRLKGYDAPESISPSCPREGELGRQATDFLRRLLAEHFWVDLTVSSERDHMNQTLGTLKIAGRNIADLMIEAGLARASDDGDSRRSWCN